CDKSCQLLKQLQKGSFFDIPLSHELRKACKRVRYVAEHLERHEKILLPCKEAQSQLGRIHDLDYWLQWLTRASPQSPHIATLRDELDHAIILFNDFIKKDGLKPLCNESFTTTT
ncbi:MAG: CHAD domain-containing protein, partial [Campylobacterales bacterium]